jgi:HEAT repeat protein
MKNFGEIRPSQVSIAQDRQIVKGQNIYSIRFLDSTRRACQSLAGKSWHSRNNKARIRAMSTPQATAISPVRSRKRLRIIVAAILLVATILVSGHFWMNRPEARANALLRELVHPQSEDNWFIDTLRHFFNVQPAYARSRYAVARELADLGSGAVPCLASALKDENNDVRWASAQALGIIGDSRAVQPLAEVLAKDSKTDVAEAAAEALGRISDPVAVEPLIAAVKHPDKSVQRAAVASLGQLGDGRALPVVIAVIHDNDWAPIKEAAIRAFGELGDVQAVPVLLETIKDGDADLRFATAAALGQLGDARALPALAAAVTDSSARVRQAAAEALGEVGGPPALAAVERAITDSDANVREAAARALGLLGNREARRSLETALTDTEGRVRFWAAIGLGAVGDSKSSEALKPLLADKDNLVRPAAAYAMALLGRAESVPVLEESLSGKTDWAAFAAVVGLARMNTPEAKSAMEKGVAAIQDAGTRRFAAKVGREPLQEALVAELKVPHTGPGAPLDYFAASALEYVGDQACLPALRQALHSRNPDVRTSARQAIRRIERLAAPK